MLNFERETFRKIDRYEIMNEDDGKLNSYKFNSSKFKFL